jgi:outer membrane lipoprotein carrier protein
MDFGWIIGNLPFNRQSSIVNRQFKQFTRHLSHVTRHCLLVACLLPAVAWALPSVAINQYVRQFERSYSNVKTLQADFTQTSFAWGRTMVESGTVYLARGGRMRWVYSKPEAKIFLTDGKKVFLYLPAEKQLRISSLRSVENAPVPLDLLLSHLQLGRFFSRVEFADQALHEASGDRVIRCDPKPKYAQVFQSCLIELTPAFDIRKLVVFYPDNSTMQFDFSHTHRNQRIDPSQFSFTPPPGTETIPE